MENEKTRIFSSNGDFLYLCRCGIKFKHFLFEYFHVLFLIMTTQILAKYSLKTIDSARKFSKNTYSRRICVKLSMMQQLFSRLRVRLFSYVRRQSSGNELIYCTRKFFKKHSRLAQHTKLKKLFFS